MPPARSASRAPTSVSPAMPGGRGAWHAGGGGRRGGAGGGFPGAARPPAPAGGGTVGDPAALARLDAPRLQPDSPLIDAGIALAGSALGPRDFFGGAAV